MKLSTIVKLLRFRYYAKPLIALMLLVLLPAVAIGAGTFSILSAINIPNEPFLNGLAEKNLGYWFVALAGVAITSWTFVGKWLLKQLEQQRIANQDITTKLIGYMERDHTAMVTVISEVSSVQKQTANVLEKVLTRLGN